MSAVQEGTFVTFEGVGFLEGGWGAKGEAYSFFFPNLLLNVMFQSIIVKVNPLSFTFFYSFLVHPKEYSY